MAIPTRYLGWLEKLAPRLFIDGRFCPIRAFHGRRLRGPTDWLLLFFIALAIAAGATAARPENRRRVMPLKAHPPNACSGCTARAAPAPSRRASSA